MLEKRSSQHRNVPGESGSQQNNLPAAGEENATSTGPVMLPEYKALYEVNSDIVGWLNIGNGLLSTPIMQRDNEYYLTHNF